MASDYMVRALRADGGFTARVYVDGEAVVMFTLFREGLLPEDGVFAVGGAGPIKAVALADGPQLGEALAAYIKRLVDATGPVSRMGYLDGGERALMLGGWLDPEDGTVWVEPVSLHRSTEEAYDVARVRGEKAYQDLATGTTHYVTPAAPIGR
jgi:hypothetical protein